jgi:hypothetical protein
VPLWFLFGLILRESAGKALPLSMTKRLIFVGTLAGIALLSAAALPVNRAGRLAAASLLDPATNPAAQAESVAFLGDRACSAHWYEGLLHHAAGDVAGRSTAWSALLDCTETYTGYMAVVAMDDVSLARQAVAAQPANAAAYFWLAPLLAAGTPDEAAAVYRQGLALAPKDGRRWLALAELLESRDDASALEAYLQACRNGDPGANGCYRAGLLAEARGDMPAAIGFYRLSKWEGALARADELEGQLAGGQP